jgi:YebC/PmpR family DNA-binding regulatory protein
MSGHSKWSTIKHKKGATDAKRSKIFTKVLKEVTIAAKIGGGDPSGNPRLRTALDKARGANVPKDNLERAIKKGTGELEGVNYEENMYEGYGPGGGALIIETLTDNNNRTVAEVRHLLNKFSGNLGKTGAVSWKFERKGIIEIPKSAMDEDSLMELVLDLGADDLQTDDDESYVVETDSVSLIEISEAIKEKGLEVTLSELQYIPTITTMLTGKAAKSAWKLYNLLDDLDDVQNVWHDFEISSEEFEAIVNG